MSKLETRTFETEIRADKDSNAISGYASVFNTKSKNLGGFVEKVSPSAFDSSLASKQDVMARFNHSDNHLLARTGSDGKGSLKLTKDDNGLRYDFELPDTTYARDLKALMLRGDVNKSSFAFRCNKDSWGTDPETGLDLRTLEDVDLVDIAPVVNPAYDSSSSGLRSERRSMLASAPAEVRSRIEARMSEDEQCSCDCDCDFCTGGDCTNCNDDDCDDPNCVDCGSNLPEDDGIGDVEANSADQPLAELRNRLITTRANILKDLLKS